MQLKTLEGVRIIKILEVFNASFADYFIPFKLTLEQLEQKIKADKTRLDLSVGVFKDEQLVAFILHGYDTIENKKVVYNGGTGVLPSQRGQGLTKQMYHFMFPILQLKGIDKLVLEVISNNLPAINSYKKVGYSVMRMLNCYKGDVCHIKPSSAIDIKGLGSYNWKLLESFWEVQPTWQNSVGVIKSEKKELVFLGAYTKGDCVGYVIYHPKSKRLRQLAVHRDFRRQGIASTLLYKITQEYGNSLSIINVDVQSNSLHQFLVKIGLTLTLQQLEMQFDLNS